MVFNSMFTIASLFFIQSSNEDIRQLEKSHVWWSELYQWFFSATNTFLKIVVLMLDYHWIRRGKT